MRDREFTAHDHEPSCDLEDEEQSLAAADVAHNPSIQAGLVLLLVLMTVLVEWLTCSLINGA